jgi:hypothetical protein
MQDFDPPNSSTVRWASRYVCPKCDAAINLTEIDLRAITPIFQLLRRVMQRQE